MCLKTVRAEEARVKSRCFVCNRAKRRTGWYCSWCALRSAKAARAIDKLRAKKRVR
jgi:hypothetical protein